MRRLVSHPRVDEVRPRGVDRFPIRALIGFVSGQRFSDAAQKLIRLQLKGRKTSVLKK
jgi:hypothetical protein